MVRLEREAGYSKAEARESAEKERWYKVKDSSQVPRHSRYAFLLDEAHHNVGGALNKALSGIERGNTSLSDVQEH